MKHEHFNVHRKVKEIIEKNKTRVTNKLVDNEEKIIINAEELKETWENYIKQLFHDNRPDPPQIVCEAGPKILIEEVNTAIKTMKENKAAEPENMQAEFLKLLDENNVKWLTSIYI